MALLQSIAKYPYGIFISIFNFVNDDLTIHQICELLPQHESLINESIRYITKAEFYNEFQVEHSQTQPPPPRYISGTTRKLNFYPPHQLQKFPGLLRVDPPIPIHNHGGLTQVIMHPSLIQLSTFLITNTLIPSISVENVLRRTLSENNVDLYFAFTYCFLYRTLGQPKTNSFGVDKQPKRTRSSERHIWKPRDVKQIQLRISLMPYESNFMERIVDLDPTVKFDRSETEYQTLEIDATTFLANFNFKIRILFLAKPQRLVIPYKEYEIIESNLINSTLSREQRQSYQDIVLFDDDGKFSRFNLSTLELLIAAPQRLLSDTQKDSYQRIILLPYPHVIVKFDNEGYGEITYYIRANMQRYNFLFHSDVSKYVKANTQQFQKIARKVLPRKGIYDLIWDLYLLDLKELIDGFPDMKIFQCIIAQEDENWLSGTQLRHFSEIAVERKVQVIIYVTNYGELIKYKGFSNIRLETLIPVRIDFSPQLSKQLGSPYYDKNSIKR